MKHEPEYLPVTVSTGVDYNGWKAVQLRRGQLSLYLVPDIGGRIMGVQFCGQDLAFVQPERIGQSPLVPERFVLDQWRDNLKFPLWGGGKTWISPESRFPGGTPYPDLDSGPYKFEIRSQDTERVEVTMVSGVCRDTRLKVSRTISMDFLEPAWVVDHQVENCSDEVWTGGIWDTLMLYRPSTVYVPARLNHMSVVEGKGDPEDGYSAFRESDLSENIVEISCERKASYKISMHLLECWMAASLTNNIGYLRRFKICSDSEYAHGHPGEIYNSGRYDYFSVESHSPLITLAPGRSASFKVMEHVGCWDDFARKIKAGKVLYEYK